MIDSYFTVTTKVRVRVKEITDLLCCGLEGGIHHWAGFRSGYNPEPEELARYTEGCYKGLPVYALEHPNYVLIIQDRNTMEEYPITLDRLKLGLTDMAAKFPHHFSNVMQDNCDAETGDVFLQCCVFGDIIYG